MLAGLDQLEDGKGLGLQGLEILGLSGPARAAFEAVALQTWLADQVGPLRRSQQVEATPAVATAFRSCAESTRPTQAMIDDESARGQHVFGIALISIRCRHL